MRKGCVRSCFAAILLLLVAAPALPMGTEPEPLENQVRILQKQYGVKRWGSGVSIDLFLRAEQPTRSGGTWRELVRLVYLVPLVCVVR